MKGSLQALLQSIVDYAGLFPPASLDMRAAIANYTEYLTSSYAWMLGRFIVPAARLGEFDAVARELTQPSAAVRSATAEPDNMTGRLSVLAGAELQSDAAAINRFIERYTSTDSTSRPTYTIDAIELKASRPDEITQAKQHVPAGLCVYFEVPVTSDSSLLAAARSVGARVKVRTGGVTPQAFPSCAELGEFLVRCAAVGIPFKATAGLHHPIRSMQRLTYADDSPRATMHGFLNLFLAATGVHAGLTADQATKLLDEQSPTAFHFDDRGAGWGQHRWSNDDLQAARQHFAISFGSCSFQEPIDELRQLGLLNG